MIESSREQGRAFKKHSFDFQPCPVLAFFAGVGEFVDATERMEEEKHQQFEKGNTEKNPNSSLQPGTFTDDRY